MSLAGASAAAVAALAGCGGGSARAVLRSPAAAGPGLAHLRQGAPLRPGANAFCAWSWWSSVRATASSTQLLTQRAPAAAQLGLERRQRRHRRRARRRLAGPQAAGDLRDRLRRPHRESISAGSSARGRSRSPSRAAIFEQVPALSMMLEAGRLASREAYGDRAAGPAAAPGRRRSALRPASRSRRSAPTSSRRHPASVRTSGSGSAAPGRGHDLLELAARGDQLVGEPGLERAGPQQRLGQRDQRRVAGSERPRGSSRGIGSAPRARGDRLEDRLAAPPDVGGMDAADLLQRRASSRAGAWPARPAPGPASTEPTGRSSLRGGALAPRGQLAGHRARARIELVDARQPLPGGVGIALVGRGLQPPALLARPLEPPVPASRRWSSSASSSRWATSSAA